MRNFESNQLLFTLICIFLIIQLIFFSWFCKKNIRSFYKVSGVVITSKYIKVYVNSSDLKKIKSSKILYIDNKKEKYSISSVYRNILKSKNIWYHEILLELKVDEKYQENDPILLTIYDKKKNILNMFKSCWKE